jgi:hypothetical protein
MARRVAAVLVGLLAAAGAAFLLLRDDGGEDYSLGVMTTRGRPFEMPVPEQLFTPGSPKTTGEALLIAEREGIRLVRMPREDGSSCWGTSEHRSGEWQLTNYICETKFNRFPDPTSPVLVLSRGGIIPGTQLRTFEAFNGVAAGRRQARRRGRRTGSPRADDGRPWQRVLRRRAGPRQGDRRARRRRPGHLAERSSAAARRVRSSSLVQ